MKILRRDLGEGQSVCAFKHGWALYGRLHGEKYKLEVTDPWTEHHFTLYRGKKKPLFRSLIVINALWMIVWPVCAAILFSIVFPLVIFLAPLVDMYKNRNRDTPGYNVLIYISWVVWGIGMFSIVKFIFS